MSANNVFVIKKYKGKYYCWDEVAETTVTDTSDIPANAFNEKGEINWNKVKERPQDEWERILFIEEAMGPFDTFEEACAAEKDTVLGYTEYGVYTGHYIDESRIQLLHNGERVFEDSVEV